MPMRNKVLQRFYYNYQKMSYPLYSHKVLGKEGPSTAYPERIASDFQKIFKAALLDYYFIMMISQQCLN
jgi:hypothetical protein